MGEVKIISASSKTQALGFLTVHAIKIKQRIAG